MSSIPLYLYAVRAGKTDQVKIGVTSRPQKRLRQLQTDCPHEARYVLLEDAAGAWGIERRMHSMIEARRGIGEWFSLPSDIEIAAMFNAAAAHPEPDDNRRIILPPRVARREHTLSKEQLYDMLIVAGWTDADLAQVLKAKAAAEVMARR